MTVNCGFLGPYQAVNEILDKDGDLQERLTHDVPGLCDNILNLAPLRSKFTFSQGEKRIDARRNAVCGGSKCQSATTELNKAVRRKGLQLECDEFPWASSEQGGKWLPESQRRIECVTRVQDGWHGNCVSKYLVSLDLALDCVVICGNLLIRFRIGRRALIELEATGS